MMSKLDFKYCLLVLMALCLGSCSKEPEVPSPAPAPETVTIHYQATVEGGDQTKASLNDQMKFVFEAGDRIFMESTNGKMYGFLSLSLPSTAGKSVALFEGDLTCDINFRPEDDTEVQLILMSPSDAIHTISDNGRVISNLSFVNTWAGTLDEAVRKYGHFTGTGTFGSMHFTLEQHTSFVVFNLSFDEDETPAGTSVTAKVYNEYNTENQAQVHSITLDTVQEDGEIEVSWVAAFAAGTALSNAQMVVSQEEKADIHLVMANQEFQENTYYTFQRTTFMRDYFTVEATQANTQITFNYADENSGVQYSFNGLDWTNYKTTDGDISLASAGDKVYLRGRRGTYQNTENIPLITVADNKPCFVYGDLMFLLCDNKYKPSSTIYSNYAFQGIFKGCTWLRLNAARGGLKLSATTMSRGCYMEMFRGTSITNMEGLVITQAPLTPQCYDSMFYGCTGLTTIPQGFLPQTTLAFACYRRMFEGCTNLKEVPSDLLPAINLQKACYMRMFFGCTKLEYAPNLPALVPQPGCYFAFVRSCSKLKYLYCALYLNSDQRVTTRPSNSYSDQGDPPVENVETWTVINYWTVFNKWLNGVQNNNNCTLYRNSSMTYPRNDQIGGVPTYWNLVPITE